MESFTPDHVNAFLQVYIFLSLNSVYCRYQIEILSRISSIKEEKVLDICNET